MHGYTVEAAGREAGKGGNDQRGSRREARRVAGVDAEEDRPRGRHASRLDDHEGPRPPLRLNRPAAGEAPLARLVPVAVYVEPDEGRGEARGRAGAAEGRGDTM